MVPLDSRGGRPHALPMLAFILSRVAVALGLLGVWAIVASYFVSVVTQ